MLLAKSQRWPNWLPPLPVFVRSFIAAYLIRALKTLLRTHVPSRGKPRTRRESHPPRLLISLYIRRLISTLLDHLDSFPKTSPCFAFGKILSKISYSANSFYYTAFPESLSPGGCERVPYALTSTREESEKVVFRRQFSTEISESTARYYFMTFEY